MCSCLSFWPSSFHSQTHLLWLSAPDEICPLPVQFPVVRPDPDRANPKIGVSTLAFSFDSRYLATKNGNTSRLNIGFGLNFVYCVAVSLCLLSTQWRWMCTCVPLVVDNMATVVWVWDMQKMSLEAVLEHTSAVRCFQWDPRKPRLALCTGNTKLYLWSPAGCVSVQVPTEGNIL